MRLRSPVPFARALLLAAACAPWSGALAQARDPDTGAAAVVVTEEQRAAVEKGLAWLAAHQSADGSWTAHVGYKKYDDFAVTAENKGHLGVTALACMAFLAGGHLPGRGAYGPVVEKGLEFVLSCVQEDGYIARGGSRMYDHAFATLFLAEICGMTHQGDVRAKLQKAIDFIVKSQNAEGGWRYEPYSAESDMSIVVCQVLALRAARNIGIRVPKSTVDRAARYVVDSATTRSAQGGFAWASDGDGPGTFRYQKEGSSRSTFPLTAAGVTALNGLGVYSDELIKKGLDYLAAQHDLFNRRYARQGHYYFWYGHYYGVQAMYTAGSPYWEPYFDKLRSVLLDTQQADGSWPNACGPGPAYGTASAVLILEIPYRFLPIFQR
ncbi:MAG: terpene cyclase/mutase family protein [Planctomycetes bacterium]|nr:terpene cyclase/mutase family protein [Planctomycetota bacterium]